KKVQEARDLIRTGQVYSLGKVYEHGMPLPGKRHFSLTIPGSPTGGPDGENKVVYHDDLFSGEIGQIGTQLDGLGHVGVRMKDNAAFAAGEPGPGMGAARWLTDHKIVLVGSDTWATEVVPAENKDRPFEVHQWLLVRHGTYNLENLDLDELAKDRVYQFAFIFAPLRLRGATGSPGNPIAVR